MAEPVIYIIDDDKANNFLTRLMLEDAGLRNFRQYRLAEEAIKDISLVYAGLNEDEYPALILLDLNMPAMDGWGFMDEFRKIPPNAAVKPKIYLLSSSDHRADHEKAKNYPEILAFLDKPLTEDVAKWLKEKYFSPSFE